MYCDLGSTSGQLGLQYIPVVTTAQKNQPSKRASFAWTARGQRSLSSYTRQGSVRGARESSENPTWTRRRRRPSFNAALGRRPADGAKEAAERFASALSGSHGRPSWAAKTRSESRKSRNQATLRY